MIRRADFVSGAKERLKKRRKGGQGDERID